MMMKVILLSISCEALRTSSDIRSKKDLTKRDKDETPLKERFDLLAELVTEVTLPDGGAERSDFVVDILGFDEASFEERLIENFEPSAHLIKEWNAIGAKQGIRSGFIPEECKAEVRSKQHIHEWCADPWFKTRNCSAAFEVPGYRLGDLFFRRTNPKRIHHHAKWFFPNSIADVYWRRHREWLTLDNAPDYETMNKVVDDSLYQDFERPDENTLVIHVRGGDTAINMNDAGGQYTKPLKLFDGLAAKAANLSFSKATLVTGDHVLAQGLALMQASNETETQEHRAQREKAMEDLKKSMAKMNMYLESVTKVLQAHNFTVNMRRNWNADCDFVYMSHAKGFVQSGGGFSQLAASLVKLRGNQIIG